MKETTDFFLDDGDAYGGDRHVGSKIEIGCGSSNSSTSREWLMRMGRHVVLSLLTGNELWYLFPYPLV